MPDYVVLKRLTLKSDLGWFKSIYDGHGLTTNQKAITLNMDVMTAIWPSMLVREEAYEKHKAAQKAAKALGPAGAATFVVEKAKAKAVATIPVDVKLHGPAGKPPIQLKDRVIALQDKNWRLNGDFVHAPSLDPDRFFPVMQEGDLALIGFDDVGWPTNPVVVLLSQVADASLWSSLESRVSKGSNSMTQLDAGSLLALADSQGLAENHIIRLFGNGLTLSVLSPTVMPDMLSVEDSVIASAPTPPAERPATVRFRTTSLAQIAARAVSANATGLLGERVVDNFLTQQGTPKQPVHTWISQQFPEHPYDFELLEASGLVAAVADAKSTSADWSLEFFMSAAEVGYASRSAVPYHIYRVSGLRPGNNAELRVSDDIRGLAAGILAAWLAAPPPGTRTTGAAIHPLVSGIVWSSPIRLPQPR